MIYNRFLIHTFLRVVFICLNAFLIAYFSGMEKRVFTLIFLSLIILYQIWNLYRYVSRTNRELADFLFYLKHGDTGFSFSTEKVEDVFKDLNKSFNEIINDFQRLKSEKEKKDVFLQTTVEHIGVGIISYTEEKEKIQIFNKAAADLLDVNSLLYLKDLDRVQKDLYHEIKSVKPGPPVLVKIKLGNHLRHYSIKTTITKIENKVIHLVSIQDIKSEMEENELNSYKKLIRVMNHEMMNSLTPITTLTSSIKRSFLNNNSIKNIGSLNQEEIDDTVTSIELIEERSKGLISFIQKHRELTNIPKPSFKNVEIRQLFQNTADLFQKEFEEKSIQFESKIEEDVGILFIDENLISQVLINLVKNAVDAVCDSKSKKITLQLHQNDFGKTEISVSDNGCGIEGEIKENLFVPFFTTKEHGSGIGLSLSRQIMQMHKGKIIVDSETGKGSTFRLIF